MFNKIKKIFSIIIRIIEIMGIIYTFFSIFFLKPYYPNKEISLYEYKVISLFNKQLDMDNLKVSYNDIDIENLYLNQFTIKNTGNVEIIPEDYIEKIKLDGDWGKIIDIDVVECNNKYIKETLQSDILVEESYITLPNVLLNSNDYYTISIISEKRPKINLSYAISGINKINIEQNYNSIEKNIQLQSKYVKIISILSLGFSAIILIYIFFPIIKTNRSVKQFKNKFNCSTENASISYKVYNRRLKEIEESSYNIKEKEKKINDLDNEVREILKALD